MLLTQTIMIMLLMHQCYLQSIRRPYTAQMGTRYTCEEFLARIHKTLRNTSRNLLTYENDVAEQCNTTLVFCGDVSVSLQEEMENKVSTLQNVCWFLNEVHEITKCWQDLEKKKQAWIGANNTLFTYTYRSSGSLFDEYVNNLKLVVDRTQALNSFANSHNLIHLFNRSNLSIISGEKSQYWLTKHHQRQKLIASSKFELYYIRTPLSSIIFITGLLGNGMMLFLFLRYKILRTSANMLLLNLAVVDTLNLVINLPFGYIVYVLYLESTFSFSSWTCKLLIYFEQLCTGLCIWSLVAMSILRYSAITSTTNRISRKFRTLLYIIIVWVIGLALAMPTSHAVEAVAGACLTVGDRTFYTHWNLLLYSVVPLLLVAAFYTLTVRHLSTSAKNMPGEGQQAHRKARNRGAKVLVTLTIAFAICYPPLYIYNCLRHWNIVQRSRTSFRVEYIFYYLIYLNSVVNPVALYFSSGTFRLYFNFHLPKCLSRRKETSSKKYEVRNASTGTSIF